MIQDSPFNPGDVVRLKTGGPAMSVTGSNEFSKVVFCQWFAGSQLQTGEFPFTSVEVDPVPNVQPADELVEHKGPATVPISPHPQSDSSFESLTVHGIAISDGQVRGPNDTFLLSDIRAVHVGENHNYWQRWLWWLISFGAVLLLRWLAFPLFLWSGWMVFFSESMTVQVTTSTGTHHLITFTAYNTMAEGASERLRERAADVTNAISKRLA